MNRNWLNSILLPLAGMAALLVFAYGCDRLREGIQHHISIYFDLTSIFLSQPLVILLPNLVAIAAMFGLFWLVMTRQPRSWLTGVIFLLAGIFLAIAYALVPLLTILKVATFNFPIIEHWGPDTLFVHTAEGMAVVGLLVLVFRRPVLT